MNKMLKTTAAVVVMFSFLAMVAVCCCAIKNVQLSFKKSCCTTKTQSSPTNHQCCLSKLNPMEIVKNMGVMAPMPWLMVGLLISLLYIFPHPRLSIRTPYLNGPPGLLYVVPFYIRFRTLRI